MKTDMNSVVGDEVGSLHLADNR